jgi:hypothetical protein
MDESGEPFDGQLRNAVARLVRFYGFAEDGTMLWVEAQDSTGREQVNE